MFTCTLNEVKIDKIKITRSENYNPKLYKECATELPDIQTRSPPTLSDDWWYSLQAATVGPIGERQ